MQQQDFFKKTIEKTDKTLKITISCTPRKTALELKRVFKEDIKNLIPSELKGQTTLVSSPAGKISNLDLPDHSSEGTWEFSIRAIEEKVQKTAKTTRKTPTSRRTRKTSK